MASSSLTDLDVVIAKAQAGDAQAFHALYLRHRDMVARVIHRVMGPSHEIEDVIQDVFVHVYRSIDRFRGDAKFTTWLYRLTVNVTKMHLRKKRSRPRFCENSDAEQHEPAPLSEQPSESAETHERVSALYRLLDRLSEKKRVVLVLHDFDGVPAAEIAEILEIPVLTVRTRLFYARKELYTALATEPTLRELLQHVAPRISPDTQKNSGGEGGP